MIALTYFLALVAFLIALDNRHSIIELRRYYNKLYKDNIYGSSVMEENNDK